MKKIKVIDIYERDKAFSYLDGYIDGINKTIDEIKRLHEKEKYPFKKIYKLIKSMSKIEHEDYHR